MIQDRSILDDLAISFSKIIEKYTEYIIVSGFVAISSGRTRGTEAIDMIIKPTDIITYKKMHEELVKKGFECLQSEDYKTIFEYLKEKLPVRYIKKGNILPEMEVKFSKDILDDYQLTKKMKLPLTGLDLWFSDVNFNVAFKEHLLKSPKDMGDAEHLRIVYKEMINEKEIQKIKGMIDKCRLKKIR